MKRKIILATSLTATLLLSACAKDTAMHLPNQDYLHKDLAEEREAEVIKYEGTLTGFNSAIQRARRAGLTSSFEKSVEESTSSNPVEDAMGSATAYLPIDSFRYTSNYGLRSYNGVDFHHGIDFAAPIGTPIKSIFNGKVVNKSSNSSGGWGNYVEIQGYVGTKKYTALYAHMKAPFLGRIGSSVDRGGVVGQIGVTGDTTGPHLHLEVHIEDPGRKIISTMLTEEELKYARKEFWWNNAKMGSRIDGAKLFPELSGLKASSQQITRQSDN